MTGVAQLGDAEIDLLEDCLEDRRGLWEIVWSDPDKNFQNAILLVTPLVEKGYLNTLQVSNWDQALTAAPMAMVDALAIVREEANYLPPKHGDEIFYLLSITPEGAAVILSGAFPDR